MTQQEANASSPRRVPSFGGIFRLGVAAALCPAAIVLGATQPSNGTGPVLPGGGAAPATGPATAPATTGPAQTQPAGALAPLSWHSRLQDGIDEAQRTSRPILVEFGADWCGWCRKLDVEIKKPGPQQRLAGWVRVRLDVDKDVEAVRSMQVGPVPALRVLNAGGRTVASRDGYLPEAEFVAWLDTQQPKAAVAAEAIAAEPTDAASAEALVARIADPDPLVRETATRRLLKYPHLAAPKIVETFATGSLATRLAALELLQDWEGPLEGLDPWEPSTLTKERIEGLKKWAQEQVNRPAVPATKPTGLSPQTAVDAKRDLAALLQATSEADALAIRERLARLGPSLLPEVYAALKNVTLDQDRQRLTALRYRLVASDALVLNWVGGFDRLAATTPATRHAALEALTTRLVPSDAPLLLELFADPDPFVRERSLNLLQGIGGDEMRAGLIRLLKDPEQNVRAAVLKQLAQKPIPSLDAEVAAYAKTEQDVDLVVHAARVLRESSTPAAVGCLTELLGHTSWRVRSEAAEGLGKIATKSPSPLSTEAKADIYGHLIKLLSDSDGFVVSRAVIALKDSQLPAAIDPMVQAAEQRPELAADVVKALVNAKEAALPHLRKFCAHPSAPVRAAAITGLCEATTGACTPELHKALTDSETTVRTAAVAALLQAFERSRPQSFSSQEKSVDMDQWLVGFRGGKGWPGDTKTLLPLLEKMSQSTVAQERLTAAVALTATGKDALALPILQATADGTKEDRVIAAGALEWMPWEARLALFEILWAKSSGDTRPYLLRGLTTLPNIASTPIIWNAIADANADVGTASMAVSLMKQAYLGDRYYNPDDANPERRKELIEFATKNATNGSELQRLTAIAILFDLAKNEATRIAKQTYDAAETSEALRVDALQVLLLSSTPAAANEMAIGLLKVPGKDHWDRRKLAVKYLAIGPSGLRTLRGSIYLSYSIVSSSMSFGDEPANKVKAPAGVTADMLRPFLADADAETSACAAQLMVLLGDKASFDALAAYWRKHEKTDRDWQRILYQTIASTGEDAWVPVLEEIYAEMAKYGSYNVREFYQAIRHMKGNNVMALRKKIRDQFGADVLR